ncbi:DUF2500 family protein [Erwinia sp. CPCC 100877]|nr:DUF2500 family protein [Erwinia sp. CPCC 100877]
MNKMPIFFIIIIVLIVVLASFRYINQQRQNALNDAAPLQTRQAVVVEKNQTPVNERRSRQRQVTPPEDTLRYEVSFRPQAGGEVLRFQVNAVQYRKMSSGQEGTLHYRGTRFEDFIAR